MLRNIFNNNRTEVFRVKTLIIYDDDGYILSIVKGEPAPRIPSGVPYVWIDVPEGKTTKGINEIGVDVSVTPRQVILEDIPPSEIEQLKKQNEAFKKQADSISADLQAFMEYYFENGGV